MKKWRKKIYSFWKLPSPSELGMSKHNALGMRYFTPFQSGPTWEDWRELCKKKYPVRYFLNEVFLREIRFKILYVENSIYKFKSLYYHKQHLIDLRGVDKLGYYNHGWISPAEIIRLSAWKALVYYIEFIKPGNPETDFGYTDEDKKDPWYKPMLHTYQESQKLYRYWTIERLEDDKKIHELHRLCDVAKENRNESEYRSIMSAILLASKQFEKTEQRMLERLIKISQNLID